MSFYKKHLFICSNERPDGKACCHLSGGTDLFHYAKNRARELGLDAAGVRVNKAGCLGRCENAPAMVIYPEGIWYSPANQADMEEIIQTHLLLDGRIKRLLIPEEVQAS